MGWGQADGAPWQPGRREPGPLPENEGGWSIPEAAGARGCLLGCAGPTRSSFWAATSAGGWDREGAGKEREGSSARPYGGLLQASEGRLRVGGGPWR